jgi:hypothetical protein
MVLMIVIALIIVLVILAVVMNTIQQQKQKQEADKRNELAKYKTIIEETEDLLMTSGSIPVSKQLILIMHQRIFDALKSMSLLTPDSPEINQRLADAKNRVENFTAGEQATTEQNFTIPDEDKVVIGIIKAIKKMRALLRTEHTKGKVDTQLFMAEDRKLEAFQLKVNIDSLMKRGYAAKKSNMIGSARQYFEKAYNTLKGQSVKNEYIQVKTAEVEKILKEIASDLKNTNEASHTKSEDDLDVLFQPKKKW